MKFKIIIFLLLCLIATGCKSEDSDKNENSIKNEISPQNKTTLNMTFTGDLLFEAPLYHSLNDYDLTEYLSEVKPLLSGDLVMGNLEVPLGGENLGISGEGYSFNGPQKLLPQLQSAGFNFLTTANNHSYDRGLDGVKNTIDCLNEYQMDFAGSNNSASDQDSIKVVRKKDVNIAILSYTYGTNQLVDQNHLYSVNCFLNQQLTFSKSKQEMLKEDVSKAKQLADIVIVAMHWGNEFTNDLSRTQQTVGKFLNDLEVDVIIGNHSHNIQPIEYLYNENNYETLVIYSLGNFISGDVKVSRASEYFKNLYQLGAILNFDLSYDHILKTKEINNIKVTPIINHYDANYQNFKLKLLKNYNDDMFKTHGRSSYCHTFNLEMVNQQLDLVYGDFINIDRS